MRGEEWRFRQWWTGYFNERITQGAIQGFQRDDFAVGNRAFCSYTALASLGQLRVDGVFRLHQKRKWTFGKGPGRAGRPFNDLEKLTQCREAWSPDDWAALPAVWPKA